MQHVKLIEHIHKKHEFVVNIASTTTITQIDCRVASQYCRGRNCHQQQFNGPAAIHQLLIHLTAMRHL